MVESRVVCHPATARDWDSIVELFGENGACGGCWCMHWRRTAAEYERHKGAGNRAALQKLVDQQRAGVVAYYDNKPAGWCAVGPRSDFVRLEHSRLLRPVDNEPVWSIVCFFVSKTYRRHGVSIALIQAASTHARKNGAMFVEAYPIVPRRKNSPDLFMFTGIYSAFADLGFETVATRSSRPIVRLKL